MTLNEFIKELQKLQEQGLGEYEVRAQYRDDAGVYPGTDDDVKPFVKHTKNQIII